MRDYRKYSVHRIEVNGGIGRFKGAFVEMPVSREKGRLLVESTKALPDIETGELKRYGFIIYAPDISGHLVFYSNDPAAIKFKRRVTGKMKEHKGFSNYATWLVACEIGSNGYVLDKINYWWNELEDGDAVADCLKARYENRQPDLYGIWEDIMADAMESVDWFEIANIHKPVGDTNE